jgi:acetyl-CoA C-acetyltransferase
MNRPIIAATARTAVGTYGGALRDISAPRLGAHAIRAALQRAGISPDRVDEVVMGNVLSAALGQGPARQAALDAGVSRDTPAMSVNMLCGSGLRAITLGAEMVTLGRCEVVVAGGMESMSSAPFADMRSRWGARMGHYQLLDCVLTDGLEDAFSGRHMGELMDEYARQLGISRQAQDEYAAESQRRCEVAMAEGRFAAEIEPLQIPQRKAEPVVFDTDEHPRPGTTSEKLARLQPVFMRDGTITAGNASGINDGAAAAVVVSAQRAAELDLQNPVRLVSWAESATEPAHFGIAPAKAVEKSLQAARMTLTDIDLIEANEAFAAQTLALTREVGWDLERVNVNGGAIALGHPIGASGARIMATLVHEMHRRDVTVGMATLCVGGGMGVCAIVERI